MTLLKSFILAGFLFVAATPFTLSAKAEDTAAKPAADGAEHHPPPKDGQKPPEGDKPHGCPPPPNGEKPPGPPPTANGEKPSGPPPCPPPPKDGKGGPPPHEGEHKAPEAKKE